MKVFVAGSTGVVGRVLVPLLLDRGHEVVGLVRSAQKARVLVDFGAQPVVAEALDARALAAAVVAARPDAIVHHLTALADFTNLKRFDEGFTLTNRFRTEVTDTLLAAARGAGTRTFVAASYCGWPFARVGGPVKTEEDPLDSDPPVSFRQTLLAIRHLEDAVMRANDLRALALRFGNFYGPGTSIGKDGFMLELVRKRSLPIVGDGAGVWSFIHVQDVALATAAAIERGAPGLYNVVDDDPAPVSEWLPALARAVGARPPLRIPAWLGRLSVGDGGVTLMTKARGGSNAKARRDLAWQPVYPTWRRGFLDGLGLPHAQRVVGSAGVSQGGSAA